MTCSVCGAPAGFVRRGALRPFCGASWGEGMSCHNLHQLYLNDLEAAKDEWAEDVVTAKFRVERDRRRAIVARRGASSSGAA